MNIKVFNGCLLAGWFLLTLGGVMWNPGAGLIIGGVAMIAVTGFLALHFGVFEGVAPPKKEDGPGSGAA